MRLAKNDRKPVEVVPGVYIGSVASSIFSRGLKEAGITHILSALKGTKPLHVLSPYTSLLIEMGEVSRVAAT